MADDAQHLEDLTDDELAALARCRREDPAGNRALDLLVGRFHRQRLSLARRYGGGADADDIAQEAALALVRAVDTHQPEKGPVGPWIWQWMWGATLRAAKRTWSWRDATELDGIELRINEAADARVETSVDEDVLAAHACQQERVALQSALRRLSAEMYDAVVFPQLARPSLRRAALAMLRHPSIRPIAGVVGRGAIHGGSGPPPSAATNGKVPSPDPRGDWLGLAACRGLAPQLFWGKDRTVRAAALETCQTCPVQPDCLLDALALPAGGGIRAGTTEKDRRWLKRTATGSYPKQSMPGRTHDGEW